MTENEYREIKEGMIRIAKEEWGNSEFHSENCLGAPGIITNLCCASACLTCGFDRYVAMRRKKLPLYKREDGLCGKIVRR